MERAELAGLTQLLVEAMSLSMIGGLIGVTAGMVAAPMLAFGWPFAARFEMSGKREEERREEKETYYATERSYGSFTRTFTLPEGIDPENARADLEEGVLTICGPKKPDVQPKKIAIGAGTDKPQAKA